MPRRSTGPCYYPTKKAWFANINRESIKLIEGKKQATAAEARERYGKLVKIRSSQVQGDRSSVGAILNCYLTHVKERINPLAETTYYLHETCIRDLLAFEAAGQTIGAMAYRDLKFSHLESWISARRQEGRVWAGKKRATTWSENYVGLQLRILRTAFNWAAGEGDLVSESVFARRGKKARMPDKDLKLKRLATSPEEHAALLAQARRRTKGNFGDLLELLNATGARPAEMYLATKDEWDRTRQAFIIDPTAIRNEGRLKNRRHLKNQGKDRTIRVPDNLVPTVERLCQQYPEGTLFRKEDGTEWLKGRTGTKIIADRFKGLVKAANNERPGSVREKLSLYSYRHGFVTRALNAGEDVAALCEYLNTSMEVIQAHYSHLREKHQTMLDLVNRMSNPPTPRLQSTSSDDGRPAS